MLKAVALLFLSLLSAPAAGQLVSAAAKCSSGYEWVRSFPAYSVPNLQIQIQLFTSVNQSPCDVAVELGGVCVAGGECGVRMPLDERQLEVVFRLQYHPIDPRQRLSWS